MSQFDIYRGRKPLSESRITPVGQRRRVRSTRDRWLIAYADMITLLLACFASLYAATLDQPVLAAKPRVSDATPVAEKPARLRSTLEGVIRAHGDVTALEIAADSRGLVISLAEAGSFPTGRAEPTAAAQAILLEIAAVLAGDPSGIRVEGHTDDVPIRSTEFASNWELSTARATHVVQFLVERGGLPPARLSAAGYGEFRPRVGNDTPAARARNRRVDIVVLNADTMRAEEPAPRGQR
jgi:chemotaxis protein MotB